MLHRLLHKATPAQRQRAPRYLMRRGSSWHFRARLPRALAASLGRHEVWRSLGADLPLARFCAAHLAARIGDLWASLSVATDDLDAVVSAWFRAELDRAYDLFDAGDFAAVLGPQGADDNARHAIDRQATYDDADRRLALLTKDYRAGNYEAGRPGAREIARMLSPPIPERGQEFGLLTKQVMLLLGEIEEARMRWAQGQETYARQCSGSAARGGAVVEAPSPPLQEKRLRAADAGSIGGASPTPTPGVVHVPVAPAPATAVPAGSGRTLREAVDRRILTYKRDNTPSEHSIIQTTSELEFLVSGLGAERHIRTVTRDDMVPVVDALQDLPPRWRKMASLGGDTVLDKAQRAREERARDPSLEHLAPNTVKGHLTTWRQLFKDEGIDPDSILNFTIRKRRERGAKEQKEFSAEEVGTIFASALFRGSAAKHRPYDSGSFLMDDWHFWSCLIAALTGARISEIAQLRPSDVTKEVTGAGEVWALRITETPDEDDDPEHVRRLKNEQSERMVPIHDQLIRIGLLRLAQDQKAAGATTLLPRCPKPVNGVAGKKLSDWMSGSFLGRLGIKRPRLGYHSFRHNMTTWLRDAGVPKDARKHIAGRERGDEDDSDDGYGSWTLPTLHRELMKIAVPAEIKKISPRRLSPTQISEKAAGESSGAA